MAERIHPILAPLFEPTTIAVYDRLIIPLLIAEKLLSQEEVPVPPFGDEANDILVKTLVRGIWFSFSKAEVIIPAGYPIEEIALLDSLVVGFGDAQINVNNNRLLLSFLGEGALIKEIDTPVDVDLAVKQIEITQQPLVRLSMGKRLRIVSNHVHPLPSSQQLH